MRDSKFETSEARVEGGGGGETSKAGVRSSLASNVAIHNRKSIPPENSLMIVPYFKSLCLPGCGRKR